MPPKKAEKYGTLFTGRAESSEIRVQLNLEGDISVGDIYQLNSSFIGKLEIDTPSTLVNKIPAYIPSFEIPEDKWDWDAMEKGRYTIAQMQTILKRLNIEEPEGKKKTDYVKWFIRNKKDILKIQKGKF